MAERIFVDTSVLVAAHDLDAGERRAIAEHVLRALWQDETGAISAQVLQEFYAALTSGLASPVPRRAARELLQAYSVWPVVTLDAMIVMAARKSGASLLIADRIHPFRPITGLDVKNPFA
jgi:predicted nucleic acid-binding protein